MNFSPYPKNYETAKKWTYNFWSTQPIAKLDETVFVDTDIATQDSLNLENPVTLLDDFTWVNYDLNNEEHKTKISTFLTKFYGLDTSLEFRKQYNNNYLEWISNNKKYIALGVEYTKKNTLIGFIYGCVRKQQVNRKKLDLVEVSLLCIHPKLRYKKLTPKLITEFKRQFNLLGYNYGAFSTTTYLSKPITSLCSFNRVLNAKILLETGFVKMDATITLDHVKKATYLPEQISYKDTVYSNFTKMEEKHLDETYTLFNKYMGKYNFHPIFTKEQFQEEFLNNKFITSYVAEDKEGNVLDFVSYYTLTTDVLKKNEKYKNIKRGYLYYYSCVNCTPYKLIQNVLIMAKKYGVDVFTATENLENQFILRELGFDESPITYHQYLYNYKIPTLQNVQVGQVPLF